MRDLSTRDGANRGCLYCRYSGRLTVECHELDLEGLAVGIDMNNRPDIADLQAFVGHRGCQHHPIVFSNHAEGLLLAGIRGHEPRSLTTRIDNPHDTDQSLAAPFSVRPQPALDNIFLPVD